MSQQPVSDLPRTWNDASLLALKKILPSDEEFSFVGDTISRLVSSFDESSNSTVKMLRTHLDIFINEMFYEDKKNASSEWKSIGRIANMLAYSLGFNLTIPYVHEVLCRKQHDYGHSNIQRFGRAGLMVRVHDKVARLENLIENNSTPNNESIQDNVMDVIGYAAIGIMWESDTFMLELK
jgi:hypothetical protein